MNREQPFDMAAVTQAIAAHQHRPGAMLPILHAIQEHVGFVPAESVPLIADALNVSRAEVHGVLSFYHDFRQQPAGQHVVKICRAEACQAVGSEALAQHAQKAIGCDFHASTNDGKFTLEPIYCLGLCACGPNVMIDGQSYGRVSAEKLDRLLQAKRGES